MFALKTKLLSSRWGDAASSPRLLDVVLPRVLRRPVRFFNRLFEGSVVIPRYFQASVTLVTIGSAILYGSIMGGQFPQAIDVIASKVGLAVNEIEIGGNTHTPVGDVYHALGLNTQRSLVSIDAGQARLALGKLPWVESARISKVYPNKLEVDIVERAAFAVWQQGEALTVIQADGAVIGGYAADAKLAALPFLVGVGAAEHGRDFIAQVAQFDDVAKRVRAYIRVGTRRWDLRLDNGMTIRLPETEVEHALGQLMALQAELGVFERDLAAIDLRIQDRTVFALTENSRDARDAFVNERRDAAEKIRKARGSRI